MTGGRRLLVGLVVAVPITLTSARAGRIESVERVLVFGADGVVYLVRRLIVERASVREGTGAVEGVESVVEFR